MFCCAGSLAAVDLSASSHDFVSTSEALGIFTVQHRSVIAPPPRIPPPSLSLAPELASTPGTKLAAVKVMERQSRKIVSCFGGPFFWVTVICWMAPPTSISVFFMASQTGFRVPLAIARIQSASSYPTVVRSCFLPP